MVAAISLAALAVVLAVVAPRVMARFTQWRRSPGPALLAWQAVGLGAVLSALLAAPTALIWLAPPPDAAAPAGSGAQPGWWDRLSSYPLAMSATILVTAVVLICLLASGHRVGTRLRALRRRHRDLVDLLDTPAERRNAALGSHTHVAALREASVRVLEHPGTTVYCLPGLRSRVVLSRGALTALDSAQLEAVLAHERAHTSARHDLILEFFTVLHRAVPAPVRSERALAEVHLLVEALADRRAARSSGPLPLAHALAALGSPAPPQAALGAGGEVSARLRLIAAYPEPTWHLAASAIALSAAALAAPWAVLVLLA